jgi:peptidyl-tRNA hydrolase, PTH1 family
MINWIKSIFQTDDEARLLRELAMTETNTMNKFLIVGLGNIGAEYANTRHNIGFKILDFFARKEQISFQDVKLGAVANYKFKGKSFFLLKPNTFMNLSGKAVRYYMDKENIPRENILVISDDLNLAFGSIRIRTKGSDGGHNGLKNINLLLGTQEYPRFRFGISDEFKKGQQISYVLGEWSDDEKNRLEERLTLASDIIKSFATDGLSNTMTTFNGK